MKGRCASLVVGGLVLLTAVNGRAQTFYVGPGLVDQSSKTVEAGESAGRIRSGFAACVYKKDRRKVDALLAASDPVSIDFTKLGYSNAGMTPALDMPACMSAYARQNDAQTLFRMDQRSFRAMMAEAAYLANHPTPPTLLDNMPVVERHYVSSEPNLAVAHASADFSDCLVHTAPHESDAFLRTVPNSIAEQPALRSLAPAIPKCVSAGQTVKLNRLALREFVADGLWTATTSSPGKN